MRPKHILGSPFLPVAVLALVSRIAAAASPAVVLDETCYLRSYYRFGADLVSPAALKAEGEKVLGTAGFERLKRTTQRSLAQAEYDNFAVYRPSAVMLKEARTRGTTEALRGQRTDPAAADWREYVFLRMFFDPYTAPAPAADWMAADFDDASWVLRRGPFQLEMPNDLPPEKTTGTMSKVHIDSLQYLGGGMQACFYRTRFDLDDPAKAGDVTLRLIYRGGTRAFLNGTEIARGHLPKGELPPDAPGDDYPAAAYGNESLRDRVLGPVKLPAGVVRKGANVLAIEVRASLLHPLVLTRQQSRSWNALHDRECLWRHVHLTKLELRASSPVVAFATVRPAGVQVWVQDIHHRVESGEFRAPGESAGTVRVVGARNGTYSAQVVVGTDKPLAALQVTPGEMKQADGTAQLPASAVQVSWILPYPAGELSWKLGDERGLGAAFPARAVLADYEAMKNPREPHVFDHITPAAPASIPAGACRPVWLTFRIPDDAAVGTYRGSIQVRAQGMTPVAVPVEVEVVGWRLPDPGQFQTFVACEQNPYAVARQYGVKLWSEEHFKLLEPSFQQLGRLGNTWLNVPILRCTEFGNREDSPVRWVRKRDGTLTFDYTVLDRYLDLAVKHMGSPRVVDFIVMHGMGAGLPSASPPEVNVFDELTGKASALPVGGGISKQEKQRLWHAFATALYGHMKARGMEKSMHWGYPLDREEDPELRQILTAAVPTVYWTAGPHQIGAWGFKEPQFYKVFGTVRYFNNWPTFRMDQGWKSPTTHLAIPRVDSSVLSLHTASYPFAFRVLTDHALALGRSGFCRVGADEWAATHYDGMRIPTWIVGMPVLFTLWPGKDGAESSARFEALLEGIQETEARIFLEKLVDRRALPPDAARRLTDVLARHFQETGFFQNKLCIFELERYYYRWQERSRSLYQAAAEAAKLLGLQR